MLFLAESTGDRTSCSPVVKSKAKKFLIQYYLMKEEKNVKVDVNLGILIGLLLTDGCVRMKKWKIIFTNKSVALQNFFKTKFKEVFGDVNFIEILRPNGVKNIEVNSKKIVEYLLRFTPTYRTRKFDNGKFPDVKIPDFIFKLPKEGICKVLQAMFSADGTVVLSAKWDKRKKKWVLRRRIKLASQNPQIKNQAASLLKKVGFNPSIQCGGVSLERKEDMIKFAKEIRFIDGVKVAQDKIWSGKDKNTVLDLLVKTFEFSQDDIQFDSKEEIVNFLKSFLPQE